MALQWERGDIHMDISLRLECGDIPPWSAGVSLPSCLECGDFPLIGQVFPSRGTPLGVPLRLELLKGGGISLGGPHSLPPSGVVECGIPLRVPSSAWSQTLFWLECGGFPPDLGGDAPGCSRIWDSWVKVSLHSECGDLPWVSWYILGAGVLVPSGSGTRR